MPKPVYDTILKRRSIRRFRDQEIPYEILERCVNAARLAPSAKNLQPLEYIMVDEKSQCESIFDALGFATNLPDGKPSSSNQPMAYIVILVNKSIRDSGYDNDVGIAAENIVLTALEEGIGSCMLASINREKANAILGVPENYFIALVVALGYPDESPVAEDMTDSTTYYKDEKGTLHVPKRKLNDILHRNKF